MRDSIFIRSASDDLFDDDDAPFSARVLAHEREDGCFDLFIELTTADGETYRARAETTPATLRDVIGWAGALSTDDFRDALREAVAAREVAIRLLSATGRRPRSTA